MNLTPLAGLRALKRAIYRPRPKRRKVEQRIVREFHKLYYYGKERTWKNNTFWLNVPVAKCPMDMWVYQEIIVETKPDVIIETGTAFGGSALFMASICDFEKRGRIITIDVAQQPERPQHERIKYLSGSSISEQVIETVKGLIDIGDRVMVVLDSDHGEEHVLRELEIYSQLVSLDCYLIVEDTNINGNPVLPLHGGGPMEAVRQFRMTHNGFVVDDEREKFFMTFNPKGYLRRVH